MYGLEGLWSSNIGMKKPTYAAPVECTRGNTSKQVLSVTGILETKKLKSEKPETKIVGDCTIILNDDGTMPEKQTRKKKHTTGKKITRLPLKPKATEKPDDISPELWGKLQQGSLRGNLHGPRKFSRKLSGGKGFGKN